MNCYVCFLKHLPHLLVIKVNSLKNRAVPRARDPLHKIGERRNVGLLQN